MFFIYLIAFFSALLLSGTVCSIARRHAMRFGLVDAPGERKIHSQPIPTVGGLGIGVGVFIPFALFWGALAIVQNNDALRAMIPDPIAVHLDGAWQRSDQLWIFLGLGSLLLLLGILDDRFNLSWKFRLGVQTLVAVAAVGSGWRLSTPLDFHHAGALLSVVWIVGLINSFNMLDNMNGLSAGVGAICAAFLAIVMFLSPNPVSQEPQFFVGGFLIVLLGALVGFLFHNNPFRASLFMGDGGAYFIGFLLAASTLTATFSDYETSPQTVFVPLLILAVPLYDTTTVLLIRLRNGKSPFVGDKNHFSHRLVDIGLSRTQAVLAIYLATAICCFGSLLLYKVDFYGAVLIFLQTLLVLVLIGVIEFTIRNK